MAAFRDSDKFRFGHTAELLVANHLQSIGWLILPSYDYTGEDDNKAPRLQGRLVSYVVPDLDCCVGGLRVWVEVKAKAKADWTRCTQRLEHGIPLRHFNHYRQVQNQSGCNVFLCVYEENTGVALIETIDKLAQRARIYQGNKMTFGGMIFFARDNFRVLTNNLNRLILRSTVPCGASENVDTNAIGRRRPPTP